MADEYVNELSGRGAEEQNVRLEWLSTCARPVDDVLCVCGRSEGAWPKVSSNGGRSTWPLDQG